MATTKKTSRRSKSSGGGTRGQSSAGKSSSQTLEKGKEFFHAGDKDYKEILMDLASNPAVKYVAAGLATAVLTRIANNMAERYPEISTFIKENLDTFGGKTFEDFAGRDTHH